MPNSMSVTFLGTCSGGGPTESRSCSSLVLDIQHNHSLWMVDCSEGTLRQFAFQSEPKPLKVNKITKIFITHMHFDHCMGIISLLANLLRQGGTAGVIPRTKPPLVELYGPAGLRTFVRSILSMTATGFPERYAVHELLTPTDSPTSCNLDVLHEGESPGTDIICDDDGLWRDFLVSGGINVDAGPLVHRAPCIGYVFREHTPPHRKLVILGDTSDASRLLPLALDADLLIHEATDTHIPANVDKTHRGDKKSPEEVKQKTIAKGHSTAGMAGEFGRTIRGEEVGDESYQCEVSLSEFRGKRLDVIQEIERQASEAWGLGNAAVAYDFMRVEIPVNLGQSQPTNHPYHQTSKHRGYRGGYRGNNPNKRRFEGTQDGRSNPPNPAFDAY